MNVAEHLRRVLRRRLAKQAMELPEDLLRKSAIVFAPHPDDETLACGGTIAKKRRAGAAVTVVFMTDGRSSHAHLMAPDELARLRRQEALAACVCLGLAPQDVIFLDYPDGKLRQHESQAADRVRTILLSRRPSEVYLPCRDEPPDDHVATYDAVARALQSYPEPLVAYAYPVWFWDHWPWTHVVRTGRRATASAIGRSLATWFGMRMLRLFPYVVDVADALADKRAALAAHRTQMERLRPDTEWPVLADVSDGSFLACFLHTFEPFRRIEWEPGHLNPPSSAIASDIKEQLR